MVRVKYVHIKGVGNVQKDKVELVNIVSCMEGVGLRVLKSIDKHSGTGVKVRGYDESRRELRFSFETKTGEQLYAAHCASIQIAAELNDYLLDLQ